jgi:hypothetical protein
MQEAKQMKAMIATANHAADDKSSDEKWRKICAR